MVARRNPLLPILAAVVALMAVVVWFRSGSDAGASGDARMAAVPPTPPADADTPADTLRTLTANVAQMSAELEAVRRENRELRQANDEMNAGQRQSEERLAQRLRAEREREAEAALVRERDESGAVAGLAARVEALSDAVGRLSVAGTASDIPVGLGLDDLAGQTPAAAEGLVWVEPLDQPAVAEPAGALYPASFAGDRGEEGAPSAGGLHSTGPERPPEPRP